MKLYKVTAVGDNGFVATRMLEANSLSDAIVQVLAILDDLTKEQFIRVNAELA